MDDANFNLDSLSLHNRWDIYASPRDLLDLSRDDADEFTLLAYYIADQQRKLQRTLQLLLLMGYVSQEKVDLAWKIGEELD